MVEGWDPRFLARAAAHPPSSADYSSSNPVECDSRRPVGQIDSRPLPSDYIKNIQGLLKFQDHIESETHRQTSISIYNITGMFRSLVI
jgi:hypothetical protein